MEAINPVWLFGGIALVCGILIGGFAYMRLNPASGDVDKLQAELEKARSDLEEYKTNVNRHFSKTSDLVSELTQDYVKVYQHLAEGAEVLGDNPAFARALEQSQGRVLISVEDEQYATDEQKLEVEPGSIEIETPAPSEVVIDDEHTAEVHEFADRVVPADEKQPEAVSTAAVDQVVEDDTVPGNAEKEPKDEALDEPDAEAIAEAIAAEQAELQKKG